MAVALVLLLHLAVMEAVPAAPIPAQMPPLLAVLVAAAHCFSLNIITKENIMNRRSFLKTASAVVIAASMQMFHPAFGAVGGIFDAVATYGADPTGATNSTAAINSAIAAAGSSGNKGVVWIEPCVPGQFYDCNGGFLWQQRNLFWDSQRVWVYRFGARSKS
jgi:hypothetical protein